jgi:hypothetical protein
MSKNNSFRFGTAKHVTEDDVFEVFDENALAADFAETWEYTETELAQSRLPSIVSQDPPASAQKNTNSLELNTNTQKNRDTVLEYNDRLPNTGS